MINFKRIMLTLLALCAIFCMAFVVSSCDGDDAGDDVTTTLADNGNTTPDNSDDTTIQKAEDEVTTSGKITYKVKVVDTDGKAVEGAFVQVCEKKDGGRCFLPVKTDANGEITMELEEGEYKTRVDNVPGYTAPADYTEFGSETSVTITVTEAN